MLTSGLCTVLELSELGVMGNGCLLVHKVGMHTVVKCTVESEVKQQLVEVLLPVAGGRQYLCLTPGMDQREATALLQLQHWYCIKSVSWLNSYILLCSRKAIIRI